MSDGHEQERDFDECVLETRSFSEACLSSGRAGRMEWKHTGVLRAPSRLPVGTIRASTLRVEMILEMGQDVREVAGSISEALLRGYDAVRVAGSVRGLGLPAADILVVHKVVLHAPFRGHGLGLRALQAFMGQTLGVRGFVVGEPAPLDIEPDDEEVRRKLCQHFAKLRFERCPEGYEDMMFLNLTRVNA